MRLNDVIKRRSGGHQSDASSINIVSIESPQANTSDLKDVKRMNDFIVSQREVRGDRNLNEILSKLFSPLFCFIVAQSAIQINVFGVDVIVTLFEIKLKLVEASLWFKMIMKASIDERNIPPLPQFLFFLPVNFRLRRPPKRFH
eukprot:TRINITY_DN15173_c0_g1_i1.p1 TRINITY_DN15173_c0_g1~~TRINITY_DN15173_c0_g1_i1.p1  ORF type:complete len:144 (-),score=26.00 TRINITY_DN15173_c0_g1_i1:49-480(-)